MLASRAEDTERAMGVDKKCTGSPVSIVQVGGLVLSRSPLVYSEFFPGMTVNRRKQDATYGFAIMEDQVAGASGLDVMVLICSRPGRELGLTELYFDQKRGLRKQKATLRLVSTES